MSSCHKGVHYPGVTLRMRRRMKGPGDSMVTHIRSLCSSSTLNVGILVLIPQPEIHVLILCWRTHTIQLHALHTEDLLRAISSLINAIDAVKKPHRHLLVPAVSSCIERRCGQGWRECSIWGLCKSYLIIKSNLIREYFGYICWN